jgi:ribonuclease Z
MLKTFALRERQAPLSIFGPPGTTRLLEQLRFVFGNPGYPLNIEDLENGESVYGRGYEIQAFNVRHRGACFGYALIEEDRPGQFDAEQAQRLGVAFGPDFGRLQRGETINGVTPEQVLGPPRDGRRVVISGDTAPCELLSDAAYRADVLVHEATFINEDAARAAETQHSTARQAATLALEAQVKTLALTHSSSRYVHARGESHPVLREAMSIFPASLLPRDFDEVIVPFPERGSAQLLRWRERRDSSATQPDNKDRKQ